MQSGTTPFFSIGIPAFKGKFLKDCIESILNQTYPYFELIIVNDCSPFKVEECVCKFSDTRIKYFVNESNRGAINVVDNWNKCLSLSSGEYFLLMGDDDMLMPNFLEEFVNLINLYPDLEVYHCRAFIIDEFNNKKQLTPSWPSYESVYENMWHRMKEFRLQYISDFIYKTSSLKEKGGFYKLPLAWASDDITAYRAALEKGIAHTQNPLFCYRKNSESITISGNYSLKIKATIEEEIWMNSFIKEHIPNNEVDKIFHKIILMNLPTYIKRKKILTISESLFKDGLKKVIYYTKHHKELGITIKDLFMAVVFFVRMKSLEKK